MEFTSIDNNIIQTLKHIFKGIFKALLKKLNILSIKFLDS